MMQTIIDCQAGTSEEGNNEEVWLDLYIPQLNLVYGNTYVAIISILLAVLYYLFRPTDDSKFQVWWTRGKYVIALIFIGTVITVIFSLTFVGNLAGLYSNSTARFCSLLPGGGPGGTYYITSPTTGLIMMGIALIGSMLLML